MATIIIPNTFSAGATIVASQHNANFSTIYNDYNGNITNANIAAAAAIAYSKLALTGSIVNADVSASAAIAYSKLNLATSILNADVSASAAIVDTKLAQITTASKVSGAALTSLSSIPAGAGVIPAANVPGTGFNFVSATSFTSASSSGAVTISHSSYYKIIISLLEDGAGTSTITLRFNSDNGANYKYSYQGLSDTATALTGNHAGDTSIKMGQPISISSDWGFDGMIIPRKNAVATRVFVQGRSSFSGSASGSGFTDISGQYTGGSNISSFELLFSNTCSGTIYLYSVAIS